MAFNMQNIITSVKNLEKFLKVPELQGAVAIKKANGQPFCYTGGFNMVFKLEHQGRKWAFRVWHTPYGEKERFQAISNYLNSKKLPYFGEFFYDPKGLLVNGVLHDTIRMEWVDGQLLKDYIKENLYDKEKLLDFAEKFLQMVKTLHRNKISHGDLQHGNILIDSNNNISLIDYDSVCVPEMEGQEEVVSGLKGYQHPSRFESKKSSLVTDYFSELIIYLSVLAIIENPDLWEKYRLEESEYLLFSENDFLNLKSSEIYKDLQNLSPMIKDLLFVLDVYVRNTNYLTIRPIDEYSFLELNQKVKNEILSFELNTPRPVMIQFLTSKIVVLEGDEIELNWKVKNASKVYLLENEQEVNAFKNNDLESISEKIVSSRGGVRKKMSKTTLFSLYCIPIQYFEGQKENSHKAIEVDVYPRPEIIDFEPNKFDITYGETVDLAWDIKNAMKVYIWSGGVCNTVKNRDEIKINLARNTKYKLEAIAFDNETKLEKEIEIAVHHKVQIIDFELIYGDVSKGETPMKLRWNVMNASEVILKSDKEPDQNVSTMKEITINPTKKTKYWIEAKNKCFTIESHKISVDKQTSIVQKMTNFFIK